MIKKALLICFVFMVQCAELKTEYRTIYTIYMTHHQTQEIDTIYNVTYIGGMKNHVIMTSDGAQYKYPMEQYYYKLELTDSVEIR